MANSESRSSMQSDQYFAEILMLMREQGRKDNPTTLQIGVMQSANSVKVDDLVLYAEDLYIADYLVSGYSKEITISYDNDSTSSDPDTETEITFTGGLKKGDLVAVQKLQNTNRYVILAKVVGLK